MPAIDKLYKKGLSLIEKGKYEEAITAFISGLDRGEVKCAYGILRTVMSYGSLTVTDEEAVEMLTAVYPEVKRLARIGDAEAMVIVAQSSRYGFVDDEEEPYMLWLTGAAELGNETAISLLKALELSDAPLLGGTTSLAVSGERGVVSADADAAAADDDFCEAFRRGERVLIDEPDWLEYEAYGINDYLNEKARRADLLSGRDDTVLD